MINTHEFDIKNNVMCDICSDIHTHKDVYGGILFGGKGICPDCTDRMMPNIKAFDEEKYIKDKALPGESFRKFILRIRDDNNTVTITTWGSITENDNKLIAKYPGLLGYSHMRDIEDIGLCGLTKMNFTTGLFIDLSLSNGCNGGRYCYEHWDEAVSAIREWDGRGDPPGNWIKAKLSGQRDRHGPGSKIPEQFRF